MKTCPECCSQMPDEAQVCHACGRRVTGKACPDCDEISKPTAKKCRYCGHDFARSEKLAVIEAFQASASLLPTFILRARFIPQQIHLNSEKIVIRTYGFFWLSHTDDDIPWEKIAGYHYRSGFFWDAIEIQTRGQKANSIGCLSKSVGRKIKTTLERMKE
ncbi:MAG: zinc ribbon domain-containing protein [Verrucomicrobiae bacterium]|nr:zinc ribbon domain-containing protein [Verrucomicrobiae bacterium]